MAANELLLETAFLAPLVDILEGSDITRQCNTLDDLTFVTLNVLRCLQSCKTGRDFIQTHGIHCAPDLSRGNYFANLSSKRRQDLTRQIADQMRITCLPALRAFDDALGIFPELDKWEVYAADGHKMAHATHDSRNDKNEYSPVNGIYTMDLRTGFSDFLCLCKPTDRGIEHELTALKRVLGDRLRCGAGKGKSTLFIYDRAIIDFEYAYNLKQCKSIYILTGWKENLSPLTCVTREIDRANRVNDLILTDETITFKDRGTWRKITARCPDSDDIFITLTNQMTLPPGILNECFRLRWNIEKLFDQQEQKLDERKAWATSETAKTTQALSICITHNLLLLFKASLKREENIEDTKVSNDYLNKLDVREGKAREAGRIFPKALYAALYRPTEISLQLIRWLRSCIVRSTLYNQAIALLRPLMAVYI